MNNWITLDKIDEALKRYGLIHEKGKVYQELEEMLGKEIGDKRKQTERGLKLHYFAIQFRRSGEAMIVLFGSRNRKAILYGAYDTDALRFSSNKYGLNEHITISKEKGKEERIIDSVIVDIGMGRRDRWMYALRDGQDMDILHEKEVEDLSGWVIV